MDRIVVVKVCEWISCGNKWNSSNIILNLKCNPIKGKVSTEGAWSCTASTFRPVCLPGQSSALEVGVNVVDVVWLAIATVPIFHPCQQTPKTDAS